MLVWKDNIYSTNWKNTHKARLYLELRLNFSARIGKTRTLGSLHTFLQGPQRQTVDRWDFKPFLKTRRLLHSAKEANYILENTNSATLHFSTTSREVWWPKTKPIAQTWAEHEHEQWVLKAESPRKASQNNWRLLFDTSQFFGSF